jgi:hypothetical protein
LFSVGALPVKSNVVLVILDSTLKILVVASRRSRPARDARRSSSSNTPAGTLAYLAAWDVHHAKLCDRRLVEQVMNVEPYRSARCVFWIVDNGSSSQAT